jgi:flagellar hook-associated protein 2
LKSSLAALQSAVAKLRYPSDFQVFKATPADDAYFTASADASALAGSHSITVSQLAQAQKLVSAPFADTNTTTVGTGTLTISKGTESFSVTIDASNGTLSGIANAINSATGNVGVSATILNDGSGYRLVLSPRETGVANAITVSVADDDGTNGDNAGLSRLSYVGGAQNLTQTQAAQDAVLTVDGLSGITSASNTVTGVIQGVTLKLKAVGSTTLDVATDTAAITQKVKDFVDAYNKVVADIEDLHKKGGVLEAQNTVLTVQSQILSVFNTAMNISGVNYSYLSQLGISLQKDGRLALDGSTFDAALQGKLNDVVAVFTDTSQGFANRLYGELGSLLGTSGVLDATESSLKAQVRDLDTRKDQMQARLDRMETRLRAQFAALDALVGSMQQTSTALMRALSK